MLQYIWRVQELFPALRYVQFAIVVTVLSILLAASDLRTLRELGVLRHHKIYRIVLAIFVLAVLSIATSLRRGGTFFFLNGFGKTVLLSGILAASVVDRKNLDRLLSAFVFGGVLYIAASVTLARAGAGRLGGGSYDPNDLGLFAVGTIPICIYFMRRQARPLGRIAGAGALGVLLFGTILSGSRGGFLALITVALYGLVGFSAVSITKRLTVLALVAGAMVVFSSDGYWTRIKTILAPQEDYNWAGKAESGRVELWKRGLGYMIERPLLGVGADQYDVAEGTLSPQALDRQLNGKGFRWSTAHNSYVQIGAELGVFGLLLFLLLLGTSLREAWRVSRSAQSAADRLLGHCFVALILAYVVGGTFLSQAYSSYLYFSLGFLMALSRLSARPALMRMTRARTGAVSAYASSIGARPPLAPPSRI